MTADIRVQGRATQGVKVINLDKRGDVIASVCCVDSDPEEAVEAETVADDAENIADEAIESTETSVDGDNDSVENNE